MSTVARLVLVTEPEELDSEELVDDEEVDSSAPTKRCPVFPAPESGVRARVYAEISASRVDTLESYARQLFAAVEALEKRVRAQDGIITRHERTIARLESELAIKAVTKIPPPDPCLEAETDRLPKADTELPPPPKVPSFAAETCRPAKLAW